MFTKLSALLSRHVRSFWYVLTAILPVFIKTGRRPVIFSRFTGMGDIICTIPAARELMKRHPDATFIYNCHPDFAAIPVLAGVASLVTSLKHIGPVGYWYRWLLGGFYHFTHGDDLQSQVAQEPMIAEFLRQFGLSPHHEHPRIEVPSATRQRVRDLLASKGLDPENLILIHPGPSWTVKEWPRESWGHLVTALRAHGFTSIAQMGVARYMNFGKVVVEPVPGAVSLVDELTVADCFAAIAQARLFVGIDSGLLHIAACERTPSVGLWGMTSPRLFYAPEFREGFVVSEVECQGCYHRRPRVDWVTGCPNDIKCMKTLPVMNVLQSCLTGLAGSVAGSTGSGNNRQASAS